MKNSCDIIRDLLPLYIDDVASPSSREMVEEHLAECADCQSILSRLKNDEAESAITVEKENIISGQRQFFKRKSAVIGCVIAGIFMIPILVCLIVNLATGSGLSWFFIVLSALLVAASLSIVPLMVPENKGLWTLGSFIFSLLLLFAVCCLYTGGKWFFVASTSVLFGLSLILLPFVVKSKVLAGYLENRQGLAVMAVDTVLYVLMMLTIGLHTRAPGFFPIATSISVPVILVAWGLFAIIRKSGKAKAKQDGVSRPETGLPDLPKNTARQGKSGVPVSSVVSQNGKPARRLQTWEIILLALGSPIWLALIMAAFAVLLSVYIVIWSVIISLWAVEVSFIAGAFGGVLAGFWKFCQGSGLQGIVMLGSGIVLAGLSVFLFFGCRAATKGAVALTKNIALWIKSLLHRKENA